MRHIFPISLIVAVGIVAGAYLLMQHAPVASVPAPVTGTTSAASVASSTPSTQATGYTSADVAMHMNSSSCWTSINGKVYDVTNWIGQHPGGAAAILSLCGTDGSAAFNAQHGGQGRPESELASFYIGPLE